MISSTACSTSAAWLRGHGPVALAIAVAVSLAACASGQSGQAAAPSSRADTAVQADIVVPNEHLRIAGIPPVPKALADRVAKYTDFKPGV